MNEDRRKRVTNFRMFIQRTVRDYSTQPACGLIHGFQKDAIQNGWGHRTSNDNWKMIFKYVENECGKFFIVEDVGNTGLIGKNYNTEEIEELQSQGKLGPNEKLARFSSLYNSGGNEQGAGLYGLGKVMYQAVSKDYLEYFDSNTVEGKYVANYVDVDDTNFVAYEGQEAVDFIKNKTGLDKKETKGTRIIIVNPVKELVDALRSGELINDINETWWRIIEKYNATIELYDCDKLIYTADIPDVYKKYYSDEEHSYVWENISLEPGYRIKKFGFFYTDDDNELDLPLFSPDNENHLLGNISYYRKDMKIGNIVELDSLNLDPKYKNRISGFLEVDSDWEEKLEKNEDTTHYKVANKNKKEFQKMKQSLNRYLVEFLEMKGLKKKQKYVDPNEDLKELANDLTDFLKDCNLDLELSTNQNHSGIKPLQVVCNKKYPNDGLRTIEYGQEMEFKYKVVKNVIDSQFTVDIIFTDENGNDKIYLTKDIIINSNEFVSENFVIPYGSFFDKSRNLVKILISSKENIKTKCSCTFPVFVGKDESSNSEDIIFKLNSIDLPNPETKRINYNEKINKIELKIVNNLNKDLDLGVSGFIQDINDRNNTIDIIYRNNEITLSKNEETIITINDIVFGDKFLNKKGPMKIKFKLSHINGLDLHKGEELKEVFITVLYEDDLPSDNASLFDIHTDNLNDKKIKSKLEHNGDMYDLIFNMDYVMYKFVPEDKNDPFYKEYYLGEMLKTLILIKFQNGDYSFVGCDEDSIKALEVDELTLRINNFVDSYMSQYFEMRG